jgi:glucose/arabinose dehydrogenase
MPRNDACISHSDMLFKLVSHIITICTFVILSVLLSSSVIAQQSVAFQNGVPVAPTGLDKLPLEDGPWFYKTGEGMDIKVELLARLEYGMAMTFLPDGTLLTITRRGKLYAWKADINQGKLREVSGGPASVFRGDSGTQGTSHGYIDIAIHPDFANNHYVYLSYSKPTPGSERGRVVIGRGQWQNGNLTNFEDLIDGGSQLQGVSKIAFGPDTKLYITTTGRGDPQALDNLAGKVLRLNDDGTIPLDNPFVGKEGVQPEIYSYGHRGALGLAFHPNGSLFQAENGPNGGDEINVIRPGLNYGWPVVSLGRTYQGPWQSEAPTHTGYEPPLIYWMPAIAVSGLMFYTGTALPAWTGDIFVGSLRTGEVNGTGHIERILLNENFEELRRESLLTDLHKRMRDLQQGPDGLIYITLEEKDGGILRIGPAN